MSNKLTIDGLIKKIQEEIDEIDLSGLAPDTDIRKVEGWNSLHGLIMMALISTEYDCELTANQIQSIRTVEDLYLTIRDQIGSS